MFSRLARWFRSSAASGSGAARRMTLGGTSIGRTVSRTGLLLKRQLWIWPILAILALAAVGYGVRAAIARTMRQNLQSQLQATLALEREMLLAWLRVQEANAEALANDQQVREVAAQLLAAADPPESSTAAEGAGPPRPSLAELNLRLGQELGPGLSAHRFVGYFLVGKEGRLLASSHAELLEQPLPAEYEPFVARARAGQATVSPPFPSLVALKDEFGRTRTGAPTMFVCAPIRDASFQVVAVLGLRIPPEREFTRILQLGRLGESGETYAVDRAGRFVSESRFDEDLILLGLLPDVEHVQSLLTLSARDPGGDLTAGFRPGVRRAELPLTRAAAGAAAGGAGVDLDGYRDYRGVPVVGAWEWLPAYELGLITEIDVAEAYRPLTILQWTFNLIFALLVLTSAAIFAFTLLVARLQRDAQKASIEARQLGQYRLEERIGAGAMGAVYRGRHAMLRRPTAIKLLDVDKVTPASIERFEREVQLTCKLNHPHTVAIYDYGRTPEGVFYYAMEYLDGLDLEALVARYGPQPEGRTIRILQQMCGSLYEAHGLGLVHRDIKPANVMLNRRGGEPDFVKVLDFGLVRALDEIRALRRSGAFAGTPLYMSPEAIQTPDLVDPRSDLYAVGAVGYFLLTGQPVFNATTFADLCQQHVAGLPPTPSERLGRPVTPELESALLACLDKNRARRPQTARDLAVRLARVPTAASWSLEEADAWWGRHERSRAAGGGPAAAGGAETRGGAAAEGLGFERTLAGPQTPAGADEARE